MEETQPRERFDKKTKKKTKQEATFDKSQMNWTDTETSGLDGHTVKKQQQQEEDLHRTLFFSCCIDEEHSIIWRSEVRGQERTELKSRHSVSGQRSNAEVMMMMKSWLIVSFRLQTFWGHIHGCQIFPFLSLKTSFSVNVIFSWTHIPTWRRH